MKDIVKSQRGVALMLVLSAIVVLTAVGTQFAYDTNVNMDMARNERERLQAYYLAKSAYSFMLLELKFDQVFRKIVEQQNLGQYLGANAQLPLCQQFPMSTGLIRAVFTGGLAGMLGGEGEGGGGEEGAGTAEEGAPEEAPEAIEEMQKDVSISQEKSAEEFLQFEGDFDAECIDESTKINLNGFYNLSNTPAGEGQNSPFDQYKQFMYRFLSRPQYSLLFETADVSVPEVINNIGDWVDSNTEINEFGGRGSGAERMAYDRAGSKYPVRNGKLVTLPEAYLINGVADAWFTPLIDYFTIYGDSKFNICTADQGIIESLIWRYVDANPNLPPLRLEDPEEMARITGAIGEACVSGVPSNQMASQVSQAVSTAIGEMSEESGEGGGQAGTGFGEFVSAGTRYFTLKLAGQVGNTTVRIKTVVDTKEQDPKKWALLYWKVY